MNTRIDTAVFPVAGLGTRFLPATKASPKEMLPVVDKPLIQYAVEEAAAAGITKMVFVTGRTKRPIEDHFGKAHELDDALKQKGRDKLLEVAQNTAPDGVECIYVRQSEALGLGHAVNCAADVVGDRPFAVVLADDLIDGQPEGVLQQMVRAYESYQCSLLGVERVPETETHKYGVISARTVEERLSALDGIVEKPDPGEAPSNLAVVGRYILTPALFRHLDETKPDDKGEIQLTDAIAALLSEQTVLAYEFTGRRYDCGSKQGYLQATVDYGLKHPELAAEFRAYLRQAKDEMQLEESPAMHAGA